MGLAFQMVRSGGAQVMLTGGAEAMLCFGGVKAWEGLRVMSRDACRPFSANRNGMVQGEGAGVFVFEDWEHAVARGADILTRARVTEARREGELWAVRLADGRSFRAKALVNAAGPWVDRVLSETLGVARPSQSTATTNAVLALLAAPAIGSFLGVLVERLQKTLEEQVKEVRVTLRLVDSTARYALTGSIIANDLAAVSTASDVLRNAAGNFYINDKPTGAVVGQQPFGGGRASGTNDKAGSKANLMRWTSTRTIKETFVPPTHSSYPHMTTETGE